ncbi:hypothetical protein F66182_1832 [Fusarium sp. NRRL 66182]|nr:hypothetical protein F66182_1832 [Fusarium sp. NRRL 66182]
MVQMTWTLAVRPLASLRVSTIQSRKFSASSFRSLSAVFSQTENTKLNEALSQIQDKIILPAYLPTKQRKLVFDTKKSSFIQQNPVVIELDGLEHKFTTINRFTDIPNSVRAFYSATHLMKSKQDWENIAILLAGYKKAGIHLKRKNYSMMIRLAGNSGQAHSIIECAKQSQKTGLVLKHKDYVVILLADINKKVISPGGKEEALQAVKWNEAVLDLLQRPEHIVPSVTPANRLYSSPVIRGMYLYAQASAVQAHKAAGTSAEDLTQALRENVEFLISAWARLDTNSLSESPALVDINPRAKPDESISKRDVSPNYYIMTIAQNIRGIELAQDIIGDAAQALNPVRDALEQHLRDFIKAGELRPGWDTTYESVTGRKPDWEVSK